MNFEKSSLINNGEMSDDCLDKAMILNTDISMIVNSKCVLEYDYFGNLSKAKSDVFKFKGFQGKT